MPSTIPCKNYNHLHKHNSFSDLQHCSHQAKLDNQHRSYSLSDIHTVYRHSLPHAHTNSDIDSVAKAWSQSRGESKRLESLDESNMNNGKVEELKEDASKATIQSATTTNQSEVIDTVSTQSNTSNQTQNESENDGVKTQSTSTNGHSTMQEYIEKYYKAPSRTTTARRTLPVIAERQQKLVENIMNYRHPSSREREAIHKNR